MTDVFKCRKPGTQCCASKTQIREVIEQKTGIVNQGLNPPQSTPQNYGGYTHRNDTLQPYRPHVPSSLQIYTPSPSEHIKFILFLILLLLRIYYLDFGIIFVVRLYT